MHVERNRVVNPFRRGVTGKAPVVNVPGGLLREGSVGVAPDRGRPANASHTRLAYMLLPAGKHAATKRASTRNPTLSKSEMHTGQWCSASTPSSAGPCRAGFPRANGELCRFVSERRSVVHYRLCRTGPV